MKRLWKDSRTLKENLRRRMPKLAAAYFEDGRQALKPGTSWDEMHAFRLRTKRFRYTLEIFEDAYGPGLRARIDSLKKVQTYLGDINDAIVTTALLAEMQGTEEIRTTLARKAEQKTTQLREYWAATFDAPGAEQRWSQYLVSYACRLARIPRTRRLSSPE